MESYRESYLNVSLLSMMLTVVCTVWVSIGIRYQGALSCYITNSPADASGLCFFLFRKGFQSASYAKKNPEHVEQIPMKV